MTGWWGNSEGRGEMGHPEKPPLGMRPLWLAREQGYHPASRYQEVVGALVRRKAAGLPLPKVWWDEYTDLVLRLF